MNSDEQRIENIKSAVMRGAFDEAVEPGDPELSVEEAKALVEKHFLKKGRLSHKIKTFFAERGADIVTHITQKNTEIIDDCFGMPKAAVITLNHFSPLDSTLVRKYIHQKGCGRLNIVVKDKNFAMKGHIGFLMRYTRTIPLPKEPRQLASLFTPEVERVLESGEYLLIYPEAEMWQNYKKPRPLKDGAYYFAAKYDVPVIPMFCELLDSEEKLGFRLHVGDAIYPDTRLERRARAEDMKKRDYEFKISAYEKAYGKPLDYSFKPDDIACIL